MASKVFEIKEETPYKELTLYPAQGEDRPLIVFNTVLKTVQENTEAILQHWMMSKNEDDHVSERGESIR